MWYYVLYFGGVLCMYFACNKINDHCRCDMSTCEQGSKWLPLSRQKVPPPFLPFSVLIEHFVNKHIKH
jgi:hypothetical protein